MRYLVFDTETSTFPSKELAATHPNQARIVQLACLLLDDNFKEIGVFSSLIKPSTDFQINKGAFEAHGITIEQCHAHGISITCALALFNQWYHSVNKVIAHNLRFDKQLIDIEETIQFGADASQYDWDDISKPFCTMNAFTPICKLQSKVPGKNKWPKLVEAYTYCFGKPFENAHDALADVRATASIYRWYLEHKKELVESLV